ncbi:MAG TPA: hypothetical protein VK849_00935 [Longimicrobiales bacterium]|nr:hypothetical protein [Longimicrobiales bacterium]
MGTVALAAGARRAILLLLLIGTVVGSRVAERSRRSAMRAA